MGIGIPLAMMGSSLIGGTLNFLGQKSANAANAQQASTQYQRGVEDMRKAGLNPGLAYQRGGDSPATFQNNMGGATGVATGAQQALQLWNDYQTAKATRANLAADTGKKLAETATADAVRDATVGELQARGGAAQQTAAATARQNRLFDVAWGDKSQAPLANTPLQIQQLRAAIQGAISNAREATSRAVLQELGRPEAEANANMFRSAFGKYIVPYAGGAKQIGNAINSFIPNIKFQR